MAEFELEITGLTHDGRGVGRHEGRVVFVPDAVPGDVIRARETGRRRRLIEAQRIELRQPSPDRTEPFCPHYGRCGGCQLQHLSPTAQRYWKAQNLRMNLARHWEMENITWLSPLTGPETGYRRRARFHGQRQKKQTVLGFRARRQHTIVDIDTCPLLTPALNAAWQARRPELAQCLERKPKQWTGVAADNGTFWSDQPGETDPPWYEVAGLRLHFSPENFIQANGVLNEAMVHQAIEWLQPAADDQVLDLFCGIGNFSLPLARRAGEVTGVEGVMKAVEWARFNAEYNGLENARFEMANLFDPPAEQPWSRKPCTHALLDPGREGAETICRWLRPDPVRRLVYVSCNPSTFVRDSAHLRDNGWQLRRIQLLDMFPHTTHTEVMALFLPR